MKSLSLRFVLILFFLSVLLACKKDAGQGNEVWPKYGYLFTTNSSSDTVYVESGNMALTSPYLSAYPLQDEEKKWTITRPASGEGVFIHNDKGEYWSIDSAFHPGLNVEQHFISIRKVANTSNLTDFSRFLYHKSGNDKTFYLESVRFRGAYVTGLGHAESGRGLRLRQQSSGIWDFWLDDH